MQRRFQLQSQSRSPIISQRTGKVVGTLARKGVINQTWALLLTPARAIRDAIAAATANPLLSDVVGKNQ